MNQNVNQQSVELDAQQVRTAVQAGLKLLTDDERVSVPPSMVTSGQFGIFIGVLNALASGQVVLGSPPSPEVAPPPLGANGDGAEGIPAEE